MHIVNVGYDSANYYVLGQGNARLLVDVGQPGTFPKLLAILRRKDIALRSVGYLLATHYHPDHAGIAQELKNEGVRLIVLEHQLPAIPLLKRWVKPVSPYVDIQLHGNVQLTLGESRAFLQGIGIAGEIVSTRGHSDDSVTLVLDSGEAFTGDALAPAGDDASIAMVAQSLSDIRALHATVIYPGHGPPRPLQ